MEERNRKNREYRARRKAEETDEQRDERNKKRHEYRARKNSKSSPAILGFSGVLQTSNIEDKENIDYSYSKSQSPSSNDEMRKREEGNRKKREYRARIKAEETSEQIEERNKKRREYRARKNSESLLAISGTPSVVDQQSPYGTGYSTVLQASRIIQDNNVLSPAVRILSPYGTGFSGVLQASSIEVKKNNDQDEPIDWLHRNETYVRLHGTICSTNTTRQDGSIAKEKLQQKRKRYDKKIRTSSNEMNQTSVPTQYGKSTCQTSLQQNNGEPNDTLYDSALFEPTHLAVDDEGDRLENAHELDNTDDDETRQFRGEDDAYESYRVSINHVDENTTEDLYDYVYQHLPDRHNVLRKVSNCPYCGAMRFQFEASGFCCRKGKITVHISEVPTELKRLFTSQVHDDTKYFRKYIRYFNSYFSFTSLGVTLDRRVSKAAGTGIYTFRVHGALYHRLDHLVPGSKGPPHLQLYFYDTEDDTLDHRVRRSPDLDINIIRNILRILQDNPYVQTFKRVGAMTNLHDYVIELNTNVTPDQRRYNAPTASQVAAIWSEGNDPQRSFDWSVIVYAKGDRPLYIKAYYGCYDPLAYPLFFSREETSWNLYMPYCGESTINATMKPDEQNEMPSSSTVQSMVEATSVDPTGR